MLRCNKHVSVSYVRWKKCRSLASCCKQYDSPTLWIGNRTTVHFWSTPWHRRLKPMWISHYINCLWRSLIFPDFTYSDVFRYTNIKKKHWEICIEISQCLISIIEMFFSNLPMFFQFSKRTKGQKDKKDIYDCYYSS